MRYTSQAKNVIRKLIEEDGFLDSSFNPKSISLLSIKDFDNHQLAEIFQGLLADEELIIGDSDVFDGDCISESLFINLLKCDGLVGKLENPEHYKLIRSIEEFTNFIIDKYKKNIQWLIDEVIEDLEDENSNYSSSNEHIIVDNMERARDMNLEY